MLTFRGARTLFRNILVSRPAKSTKPMTQSVLRRVQPLSSRLATSKASLLPSAFTTAPSKTYSLQSQQTIVCIADRHDESQVKQVCI